MLFDDLIGVPFKHGGRDLSGLDCYGLLMEAYRRQGIVLDDPYQACSERWGKDLCETDPLTWMGTQRQWQRLDAPVIGCAVAFSRGRAVVDHVGVWVGSNQFIHTMEKTGCVLAQFEKWLPQFVGFYAYRS